MPRQITSYRRPRTLFIPVLPSPLLIRRLQQHLLRMAHDPFLQGLSIHEVLRLEMVQSLQIFALKLLGITILVLCHMAIPWWSFVPYCLRMASLLRLLSTM